MISFGVKKQLGVLLLTTSVAGFTSEVSFAAHITSVMNQGEPSNKMPKELEGIGITEQLGKPVDTTLSFKDEDGKTVVLSQYFHPGRPVFLSLVYYGCPNLCGFYLNGVLEALKKSQWTAGKEFEAVVISIDPTEGPDLAREKKASVMAEYGRPGSEAGWHFLTGKKDDIAKVAGMVGFGYRWDNETQQFAHSAAAMILSPEGEVSRYLYGINFDERTFRLALSEASKGRVGGLIERALLYCYRFDPNHKKYAIVAMNVMKIGGAFTILVLAAILIPFWRRQSKQQGVG